LLPKFLRRFPEQLIEDVRLHQMKALQPSGVVATLKRRPEVHMFCNGGYLQAPLQFQTDLSVLPLRALGFTTQVGCIARYATDISGVDVDQNGIDALSKQGMDSLPVVALFLIMNDDQTPQELEQSANKALERAGRIIGLTTGDEVAPFALLACTTRRRAIFAYSHLTRDKE